MKISFIFLLIAGSVIAGCSQPPLDNSKKTENQTRTGFYWPTGTDNLGKYAGWLYDGCSWPNYSPKYGPYWPLGKYHIGKDIEPIADDSVYAIADGKVVRVNQGSGSGWPGKTKGEHNKGIFVEHQLNNKNKFIALYGHVVSDIEEGDPVFAGKSFATIGPYDYEENGRLVDAPHLHFGIHRENTMPDQPYGRMDCLTNEPSNGIDGVPKNGFEDPIDWILTKSPLNGAEVVGQSVPLTDPSSATAPDNLSDDERAVKARFESKMKEKPNCEIKISSVYTQNFFGLTEADRANGIKSRNTVWLDYIVRQGNEPWFNGTHYYTVENGKIDERSDPWYCK